MAGGMEILGFVCLSSNLQKDPASEAASHCAGISQRMYRRYISLTSIKVKKYQTFPQSLSNGL